MNDKLPVEQVIVEIRNSNEDIASRVEQQQVATQKDVDDANMILKHIAKQLKIIEEKRKTFTQPLNQSLKEINNTFKELRAPLEKAKGILSGKVMDWRKEEQAKIEAERERIYKEEERRRKIQEAHAEKGHEVSEPVVMAKPRPLEETDSTSTRKVWTFEIVDFEKVPHQYLIMNNPRVNEAIRSGVREIPGLRIYQDEIMVIK